MTRDEFSQFAALKDIDKVVFYRPFDRLDVQIGWEVWAYDFEGSFAVSSFGNCLTTERNSPVLYRSLDEAFAAVRASGFEAAITIEGHVA